MYVLSSCAGGRVVEIEPQSVNLLVNESNMKLKLWGYPFGPLRAVFVLQPIRHTMCPAMDCRREQAKAKAKAKAKAEWQGDKEHTLPTFNRRICLTTMMYYIIASVSCRAAVTEVLSIQWMKKNAWYIISWGAAVCADGTICDFDSIDIIIWWSCG